MAVSETTSSKRIRFGLYELDEAARELRREVDPGEAVQERPFAVLAIFVERPGEVIITRDEFRQRLWLRRYIRRLRCEPEHFSKQAAAGAQ